MPGPCPVPRLESGCVGSPIARPGTHRHLPPVSKPSLTPFPQITSGLSMSEIPTCHCIAFSYISFRMSINPQHTWYQFPLAAQVLLPTLRRLIQYLVPHIFPHCQSLICYQFCYISEDIWLQTAESQGSRANKELSIEYFALTAIHQPPLCFDLKVPFSDSVSW